MNLSIDLILIDFHCKNHLQTPKIDIQIRYVKLIPTAEDLEKFVVR